MGCMGKAHTSSCGYDFSGKDFTLESQIFLTRVLLSTIVGGNFYIINP